MDSAALKKGQIAHTLRWGKSKQLSGTRYAPELVLLRSEARAEGWTTTDGIREFAKEEYNATLILGRYGDIIGMKFQDYDNATMFALKINRSTDFTAGEKI